jgi:hypothetical protein
MRAVPNYDAFGREIGEDTLAGLGGAVTPEPPTAEPRPPQPQPPAPTFSAERAAVPRRRRGAGVGCLVGLVILAAIVVAPILAMVGFIGDAGDTIEEITDTIDGIDPDVARAPPVGVSGASMVSRTNFAKALARMQAARLGRVDSIRLSPDRVAAQLVKGSRIRDARIDFEGAFERGDLRPGVTSSTVALSAIDAGAPVRLVRGSRRYGVRPRGIDYLVLTPSAGGNMRWVAYFKRGVYVEGDAHGRVTRRIS